MGVGICTGGLCILYTELMLYSEVSLEEVCIYIYSMWSGCSAADTLWKRSIYMVCKELVLYNEPSLKEVICFAYEADVLRRNLSGVGFR